MKCSPCRVHQSVARCPLQLLQRKPGLDLARRCTLPTTQTDHRPRQPTNRWQLEGACKTMNLEQISASMDKFEQQFERALPRGCHVEQGTLAGFTTRSTASIGPARGVGYVVKHARCMRTVVRAHATSRFSQSLWRTPCRRRLHRAAIPMRYGEGTVKGAATRRLATCNAKRAHWYTCFAALLDAHTAQHTSAGRCATFTLKHATGSMRHATKDACGILMPAQSCNSDQPL